MKAIGVAKLAWILLGLLAIAAALMSLGSTDMSVRPAANSYSPSGSAAFAELLRRAGYQVVISNSISPNLHPGDLALCFFVEGSEEGAPHIRGFRPTEYEKKTAKTVQSFLDGGGGALILNIPSEFQDVQPASVSIDDYLGIKKTTLYGRSGPDMAPSRFKSYGMQEILPVGTRGTQDSVATLSKIGKGYALTPYDGLIATNRYIDHDGNAAVLLRSVGLLARPGSRVVFAEGTWGNADEPSLMEMIGPWALGAWRQLLILGAVIIFTLGRRFGIGIAQRSKEQGSRELVDAVAFIYERARSTNLALGVAVDRAETLLRRRLKLNREISGRDLASRLPDSLGDTLLQARRLSTEKTDQFLAFEFIRKLDQEVDEYLRGFKAS